jgi:hypothetical protein
MYRYVTHAGAVFLNTSLEADHSTTSYVETYEVATP